MIGVTLIAGLTGLVLMISGRESVGALLMGLTGIVLGSSVIIARMNDYARGSNHS